MTDISTSPVIDTTTNDGDHDRFAHYVPGRDGRSGNDILTEAIVMGTPVRALCGKVFVPSRDPERYPICPTCVEIAGM